MTKRKLVSIGEIERIGKVRRKEVGDEQVVKQNKEKFGVERIFMMERASGIYRQVRCSKIV